MATIPSKQLHRSGSKSDLLTNLSDREIGFCEDDKRCYIAIVDRTKAYGEPGYKTLYLIGKEDEGIQEPTEVSLLVGSTVTENEQTHGVYAWKTLTKVVDSNTGATLWKTLQNPDGPGNFQFRAYVADNDSAGHNIAQTFDTILDGVEVLIDRLHIEKVSIPFTSDFVKIGSIGSLDFYIQKPTEGTSGEFLKVYCSPKSVMRISGMGNTTYPARVISNDSSIRARWSDHINTQPQEVSVGSMLKLSATSGIADVWSTGDGEPFLIEGWVTAGDETYRYTIDYRGGPSMTGYYVKLEFE